MNQRFLSSSRAWAGVVLAVLAFFVWVTATKVRHVREVNELGNDQIRVDAGSPTGYAAGVRRLIIPGHNEASYRWIAQTEQMFARHEWRVRHVDYDNPPRGHDVSAPSLYRWWLGTLAWIDHEISGRSLGGSIERAAIYSDPLLLFALVVVVTALVARTLSGLSAALVAGALVTFFPWIGDFVPALPNASALALVCLFLSILLLLPGIATGFSKKTPATPEIVGEMEKASQRWFFAAGGFGGFGLWLNVSGQLPIEIGLALGGILAEWLRRKTPSNSAERPVPILPWRAWSLGGGCVICAAYLAEYYPDQLRGWRLQAVHPLYALAWIGLGQLLCLIARWFREGRKIFTARNAVLAVGSLGLLFALLIAMGLVHRGSLIVRDASSIQLSKSNGAVAENIWAWLIHDGISSVTGLVVLPLVLLVPAIVLVTRAQVEAPARAALAIVLGPVAIAVGYAFWELSWWRVADATLMVLLIPITEGLNGFSRPAPRRVWISLAIIIFGLEAIPLLPAHQEKSGTPPVDRMEVKELVERDLAHWLNKQGGSDRVVVLAPANDTSSLIYYGGMQGLATLDPDNSEGLVAAVRITSATTAEEAQELIANRGITHIIIPSWDSQLDDYAKVGVGQLQGSFIDRLHQWAIPAWLRPVPYQLPELPGQEGQFVTVFAVVDEQEDPVRFSRMAEYYIEMNRLDLIASIEQNLHRFPGDTGSLVALMNAQLAVGDETGSAQTFKSLLARLSAKTPKAMAWDRRVALAVLLARNKKFDLARDQAGRCFAEANEADLRVLSSGSLYHFMVLGKAFDLNFADPKLAALALDLLPIDSRLRL